MILTAKPRLAFIAIALASLVGLAPLEAANPTEGTVSPTIPSSVSWDGTAIGTGGTDEASSVEGINRDTFTLHVAAGDYTGKTIAVNVSWTVSANDYDLYIHKRNPDGTDGDFVADSTGGAPSTEETTSFNPVVFGTGDFNIVVVYFANTPGADQPHGTASVITDPTKRTAKYLSGGITFAPNSTVKAQTAHADGEPSSRVDLAGNYYVCGIRGVPGGVDLWNFDLRPTINGLTNPNFDPNMRVPFYRGQPDSTTSTAGQDQLQAGALGGGDIDIATGFGPFTGLGATGEPVLAYSSLTAANLTVGRSLDHGATFQFNPLGNFAGGVPVNDRQWMGFFGANTVYLEYRNFIQGIAFVQQSIDGGLTYGPAIVVGAMSQTGSLDVDQFDGTVYISGNDGQLAVGTPAAPGLPPLSYTFHQPIPATTDAANIFVAMRVAKDHPTGDLPNTVYMTYSDGNNIFLISSGDKGNTWASPVQVNNPSNAKTNVNLMPWLATGPTPGSVGIAWYATDAGGNNDDARWRVYFAQSLNATATQPTFRIVQASDHSIHASNISLKGLPLLEASPNRNLIDYFQINFDPQGAAVIGYTDDHNDFDGHTYVARQISGPSIKGGNLAKQKEGTALPAQPFAAPGATPPPSGGVTPQAMQPGLKGEQVTDFAYDQDSGLLAIAPEPNPIDIITVKYSAVGRTSPLITGVMTVSNLTVIPPNSTWRMYFAANAPETGLVTISGNSYSKGLSDDADQFFIDATTDATGTPTFSYGTTVRDYDGGTTDTIVGTADSGAFDQTNRTITVSVSSAKLNTILSGAGHATIGSKSVFCGLRARSSSIDSLVLEDVTRGGTEFAVTDK